MLNLKLILVYSFIIIFFYNKGYAQQTEIFISDRKLEQIFNRSSCGVTLNPHLDASALWEEDYGIEFLLKKINAQGEVEKLGAIALLAKTKNPKYIEIIAPYLNDSNEIIAQTAALELVRFRTDEIVSLLEEKLVSGDKKKIGLILNILDGLNLLTNESSLVYLDSFINNCDIHKIVERTYLSKARKIRKNIAGYNGGTNQNRKILIEDALFAANIDDPKWAMAKIRESRDTEYLPLLRKANSYRRSTELSFIDKMSIILLMGYLGETDFEETDLLMLNRLKQSKVIGREKTMKLLRRPLTNSNKKGGDF